MTALAEDLAAIQQVLNRYTDAACRQDWAALLDTYAPDGVWAVPSQGVELAGRAAIAPALPVFVAQFEYWVQMNTPAVIEVDGDTARASCIIRECGRFAGRDEGLEVLGRYEDELARTTAGWKFTRRTFSSFGMQRFPLASGAALG